VARLEAALGGDATLEHDVDAAEMESLEREILADLGIPDPYADR